MQDIKTRILDFIAFKDVSKYFFTNEIGVNKSYLNQGNDVGSGVLEKIAEKFPELSIEWLVTGNGSMIKGDLEQVMNEPIVSYNKSKQPKEIPLIPYEAMAGKALGDSWVVKKSDVIDYYTIPSFHNADFLIPIKGDSMQPLCHSGDIVACEINSKKDFIQWNQAYVIDTTQGILFKRIVKAASPDKWILRSDNKEYDDIEVDVENDIISIAIFKGIIKTI